MRFGFKKLFILIFLIGGGYVSWRTYHYLFDKTSPILSIAGIETDRYYAGDSLCLISGNDGYCVSHISVWLDEKLLVTNFKIHAKEFEYPFSIQTRTLQNGKHRLKVEVVNSTFSQSKTIEERVFFVDNVPLQAAFVRPDASLKVFQGRTLHIQFQVNKNINKASIHTLSSTFACYPESNKSNIYECFIPISCEETPNEYMMNMTITDQVGNVVNLENKFQVVLFPFKKQILRLNPDKVKDEKELGLPEKEFERRIEELVKQSPQKKLWHGTFYTPIDIKGISTEFGTIRTTQEKGRYMHKALDVLNLPKSVVWATQDGNVVVKERFAHSGNTVVIDHGCGIFSLFFHLDSFADIKLGDSIKRGNPLGTLGKTGYASGYHLHWEMRINNIPIDPMEWTKANF